MKVHVYASYKRSPVGFQLGSFSYVKDQMENYALSFCQGSKIIYNIFEQDFITKAYGRFPCSNSYLFLIKDLEYTYENHEEFGKKVYINIAFEVSDPVEFSRFVSGYNAYSENVIAKKMADFIIPDEGNKEYALVIDAKGFNRFVNELLNKPISQVSDIEHFELVTKVSSRTSFDEKVTNIFNLTFERDGNKYYYPPKKKIRTSDRKTFHRQAVSSPEKHKFPKSTRTNISEIIFKSLLYLLIIAGIIAFGFALIKGIMFLFKR